jgi:alpha-L-arabinofuranosidase
VDRRRFLRAGASLAGTAIAASAGAATDDRDIEGEPGSVPVAAASAATRMLRIDPAPLFEFSALFYMQFMEPLGTTDASVEAGWDYARDDWREDFILATRALAPDVVRYGGLLSRYYKWREGIGPPARRPWMRNYVWGGKEPHRAGTHEVVDFCRRVGAAPLYCVNFASDGERTYARTPEGDRSGDAHEAAEWVSYCNDPDHAQRRANGAAEPLDVRLWQLGNETSYGPNTFSRDEAIATTVAFARAMRARDPSIQLIGWGDDGWAAEMVRRAGEHIDWVAVHMMQQRPVRRETVLNGLAYQRQPERAWEELLEILPARVEHKLLALEAALDAQGSKHPVAITEGHLSLAPHNANPILTEWLTGVYHARVMNLYHRHGARVRMCTGADFNGMRWTSNALLHEMPRGRTYMLPVAAVMALFKRYQGRHGVAVVSAPSALDVAASRTGDRVFLHVANMEYMRSVEVEIQVEGMALAGARVLEIAPEDARAAATTVTPDAFVPREYRLSTDDGRWRVPARSVSVVVLELADTSERSD